MTRSNEKRDDALDVRKPSLVWTTHVEQCDEVKPTKHLNSCVCVRLGTANGTQFLCESVTIDRTMVEPTSTIVGPVGNMILEEFNLQRFHSNELFFAGYKPSVLTSVGQKNCRVWGQTHELLESGAE